MNYRERAEADIRIAEILISPESNPTNDESLYDGAAYHVQQGIEKTLKYVLHDVSGISDETKKFRIHNIDDLIDMVETETNYVVSDQIKEMAEEITSWEANSRYGSSTITTRAEIEKAIKLYQDLKEDISRWRET